MPQSNQVVVFLAGVYFAVWSLIGILQLVD